MMEPCSKRMALGPALSPRFGSIVSRCTSAPSLRRRRPEGRNCGLELNRRMTGCNSVVIAALALLGLIKMHQRPEAIEGGVRQFLKATMASTCSGV